ncbi:hypothetical protein B2J93_5387 [Marssonina coronariae]|uniref:Erythromycin biosynthesis protein CIII-like C-terminal domain-containing protein n=1 Tax=Diplocarpon coronariae TaxID=2795749 RepID=A0A218Z3X3_9HELO|nr:hypothetical protein B2J93_5387 [Marssonina coronariae]
MKPLLLFCSTPGHGHVMPVKAVAKNLVARGYEAMFLTGSELQSNIEEAGITFRPLLGRANWALANIEDLFPKKDRDASSIGSYRLPYAMRWIFASTIPDQHDSIQGVLREILKKNSHQKVIIIQEYTFWGTLPTMLGAQGLKPTAVITLGTTPLPLKGPEIPPFGLGLSYDSSPSGIKRNKEQYKYRDATFLELTQAVEEIFQNFGIKPPNEIVQDLLVLLPDRYLQMCVPSLEYPRPEAPPGFRFVGSLPAGHRDAGNGKPSWWDDVVINASQKKIVAVSQGTATTMWEKLIVPTMAGLSDREDILVIAALGREGASLPDYFPIPENSRVGDFVPFDELLPCADVFVTNGGYGAFQHSVIHAVPLIVAGITADKPEVAARVEWAGLGINMKTETPSPEEIREAVERVLNDGRYKLRAKELVSEIERYNIFDIVEDNIVELAARTN